ncbi:MAG: S8 family peptidase [Reichenbachiella sp.]
MSKSGILFVLLVWANTSFAQIDRYIVFFPDKANSSFSIDQPEDFLSQRALDRRERQNISITSEDLPVSGSYLDSLNNYSLTAVYATKWLNGVMIEATADQINLIKSRSFVSSIELVAPGSKITIDQGEKGFEYNLTAPAESKYTSADQLNMLGADEMHQDNITGMGIWIGVFDAGFKSVNESAVFVDLFSEERLKNTFDFTQNNYDVFSAKEDHGTSVLSCIVSASETMTGTSPDAMISLFVTEDPSTEFPIEEYNWLFAAEKADSLGIDVISSSLGYYDFDQKVGYDFTNYTYEDLDGKTSTISKAAQFATDRGILVVTSAGNEGNNDWQYITMPADVADVITVGAVTSSNNLASFSSTGPTSDDRVKPDVVAKGVYTTVLNGDNEITIRSGTSFSGPLISGFAASVWQLFPDLTNKELKDVITGSGDRVDRIDTLKGFGIPSYNRIVDDGDDSEDILSMSEFLGKEFHVFPNPIRGNTISIRIEREFSREDLVLTLYSPNGEVVNESEFIKVRKGDVLQLDFNDSGKGIYILRIQMEDETKHIKVLKI